MSIKAKLIACLGVVLAPSLLSAPASAQAQSDETLSLKTVVPLQAGQVLRAFDISWVDPNRNTYALSASALNAGGLGPASNPEIIIVDTTSNKIVNEFNATPTFAGNCSFPPARDTFSGPNGVLISPSGDIWAADGPIFNTSCDPTSGVKIPSSVKVLDLKTGATKKVISTGGQMRSDELCFNARFNTVLVANPSDPKPFITFIAGDTYSVLQKISFDGTDPNGANIVANGIEQCQFNPRNGKFYLNIPAQGTDTNPGPGVTVVISGHAPFKVENVFTIPTATGCTGPAGLAVGPNHQLALACDGTNSLIIDDTNGSVVASIPQAGFDQDWYNPGSNHYYLASGEAGSLAVADAGGGAPPTAPTSDPTITTASGSHSVAADPIGNQVYVPIRRAPSPSASFTICGSANGCIAVYTATNDDDDQCVAFGTPASSQFDGNPLLMHSKCNGHNGNTGFMSR
jgi:hypothetical protein